MRVLPTTALVLALAACGGGVTPLTAAQVKQCSVRVFFATNATRAQEDAVGSELRTDSRVVRVTFVSKERALAQMTKKYPDLVQPLPSNPLPDAYIAVPDQLSDAAAVAASARLPGVANITQGLPHFCSP